MTGMIDCRKTAGCEEMSIKGITVFQGKDQSLTFIAVCGNAQDGLLIYDLSTQTLIHRSAPPDIPPLYPDPYPQVSSS